MKTGLKSGTKMRLENAKFYKILLMIILTILMLRTFVFEIYLIPSDSMRPTLFPGDVIFVNKLAYGARQTINEKTYRFWGYGVPKVDDVIVFNFPEGDTIYSERPDRNFYQIVRAFGRSSALADTIEFGHLSKLKVKYIQAYIKRCVAGPNDTLTLHKGSIQVNVPHKLTIDCSDSVDENAKNIRNIFPHNKYYNWRYNAIGPLWVPARNEEIALTVCNLPLYRRIIGNYENNRLSVFGDEILINNEKSCKYRFQQNYYYMLGDNKNSYDSRFWGFLPEDHIIGKASFIIFSFNPQAEGALNKVRWERLFKKIGR